MQSHLDSHIPNRDICESDVKSCLAEVELRYAQTFNMSFTCVDVLNMSELNGQHRGHYRPTNVLSFHYGFNNNSIIGEVFFCPEVIEAQALSDNISLRVHYMHLIFHSLLHILGHTHQDDVNRDKMEREEIILLHQFGIQSPYEKLD